MKRFAACILSVFLVLTFFPGLKVSAAGRSVSGSHGDSLHWEYDGATDTLTISGTGEMPYDSPYYGSEEGNYGWYYLRDSIRHLVIGEGITRVSDRAFMEYPSLRTVSFPVSLQSIGDSAFKGCTMLTDISFLSAPEELGTYVFSGCISLTSVSLPEGLTELPRRTFSDCSKLTGVHLPDTLEVIGIGAFEYCYNLKEIQLPQSLTCIREEAFQGCTGLVSVYFPDTLEVIGESAFSHCRSIREIQLPQSLKIIEANTFESCTALETVQFPSTLETIEEYAFKDCTALAPVKLSAGTRVDVDAFEGCPEQGHLLWNIFLYRIDLYLILAAVVLTGLIGFIRVRVSSGRRNFWSRVGAVALVAAVVIAAGIGLMLRQQRWADIPDESTYEYDAATKTLTASGTGGLYRLDAWYPPRDGAVEHLVIEEGITEIGHYVFNNFPDLKTVSLPDSLQVIRGCAFAECGQLTDINIPWHTRVSHTAFYMSAWPPAVAVRMFLLYAVPFLLCIGLILALVVPSIRGRLARRKSA